MNTSSFSVKVYLWGLLIGKLSWDSTEMKSIFSFSEEYLDSCFDISPVSYSKDKYRSKAFYGEKAFEGLPSFLADSLPDDWGNTLFDKWTSQNSIPLNEMRSLLKLSFIGKRGMGALEFVPSQEMGCDDEAVDIESLYEVAMMVLHDREQARLDLSSSLSLKQLIALGTSAGGKHAKGVISINGNNEMRSGQIALPEDYRYYLLKFNEDPDVPTCEIEKIYYDMAVASGITMMPSRLLPVGGVNHFLTERFDRKSGGEKVHVQSLRALSPLANDYMNLFWLCEKMHLPSEQREELFRRMVFNFVAGISDDHNRNFSFLMDSSGQWSLAPAYDLMFTSNTWVNPAALSHSLGMWQKRAHVTLDDFVDFGSDLDIPDCRSIVREVCECVATFPQRCNQQGIPGKWTELIWGVIKQLIPKEFR